MDLVQDCPQPSGVWRPVMGTEGQPLLCVRPDPENPLVPRVWNKPAMAEWPAAHEHGEAVVLEGV